MGVAKKGAAGNKKLLLRIIRRSLEFREGREIEGVYCARDCIQEFERTKMSFALHYICDFSSLENLFVDA